MQALLGLTRDGFTLVALLFYLVYLNWKLTLIVGLLGMALRTLGWVPWWAA